MGIEIPGLLTKKDLTDQQMINYERAIKYRGDYIEQMVYVENKLEVCITTFFNIGNNKNIFNLLYYFVYTASNFSFAFKLNIVQQIIRIAITNAEALMPYCKLIGVLIELRTYIAHHASGHEFNGISYFKGSTDFKVVIQKTNKKEWVGDIKKIEINRATQDDIWQQVIIANEFLMFVRDSLETDIDNRENKIPSERLDDLHKSLPLKYTKVGGVFTLGLRH